MWWMCFRNVRVAVVLHIEDCPGGLLDRYWATCWINT